MTEADGGCQRLLEAVGGHQYVELKIFQERLHFSASQVPHVRHLRHVLVLCLILRHLLKSTNKNPVLKNKNTVLQNNFIPQAIITLQLILCSIQQVFIPRQASRY